VYQVSSADGSVHVRVHEPCIGHWFRHRQRRFWHREAGGLLFAPSVGSGDGQVDIEVVTGPNPGDRRTRYSCALDHAKCRADISEQFRKGMKFVGYWHTHPEPDPSLSGVDRRAFARNLVAGGLCIDRMLAVVIGNGDSTQTISVCLVETGRVVELGRHSKETIK